MVDVAGDAPKDAADRPIVVTEVAEGRFARFHAIKWWNQALLREARVLVVGAGALGNEVIKNLALLGVGNVIILDMDRVEESNLSRSVLFRAQDEGRSKVAAAARAAREIYPDLRVIPRDGNILCDIGLGYFRWANVVVGALDNREARVFVNRVCAQVGRPWIDGGIDVLNGIVRGFAPPATACYECTMGQADWDLLAKRRSCSLLARRAFSEGGAPTTPTTASVVGAIQAQEVVKQLHGLETLRGGGFVFEGLTHHSFTVNYPIAPDCPWHGEPAPIEAMADFSHETPMREIWDRCSRLLGGLDAIDLSRELIDTFECPACGISRQVRKAVDALLDDEAGCRKCGAECVPRFVHSLTADSALLGLTPAGIGLPKWDILWARRGERMQGSEMSGDSAACLSGDGMTD
jgi:molybdopterin/thiamine biosynthesis adenylyltransferase